MPTEAEASHTAVAATLLAGKGVRGGAGANKCTWPLEARKTKDTDSLPEPLEGTQP